jgi:hypothetical protein
MFIGNIPISRGYVQLLVADPTLYRRSSVTGPSLASGVGIRLARLAAAARRNQAVDCSVHVFLTRVHVVPSIYGHHLCVCKHVVTERFGKSRLPNLGVAAHYQNSSLSDVLLEVEHVLRTKSQRQPKDSQDPWTLVWRAASSPGYRPRLVAWQRLQPADASTPSGIRPVPLSCRVCDLPPFCVTIEPDLFDFVPVTAGTYTGTVRTHHIPRLLYYLDRDGFVPLSAPRLGTALVNTLNDGED